MTHVSAQTIENSLTGAVMIALEGTVRPSAPAMENAPKAAKPSAPQFQPAARKNNMGFPF